MLLRHFLFFVYGSLVWLVFWLLGWPDYYQQYSAEALAFGIAFSIPLLTWLTFKVILATRPPKLRPAAYWMALYTSVPLLVYDYLYCGLHLGHGWAFLWQYWYLTVYYFVPWILLPPISGLLERSLSLSRR